MALEIVNGVPAVMADFAHHLLDPLRPLLRTMLQALLHVGAE